MLKGGIKKQEQNYVEFDREKHLTIGLGDSFLAYKKDTEKTSIHFEELKLFLSELEFITLYLKTEKIPLLKVIYNNSKSIHHIFLLSFLFPALEFHIYDCNEQGMDKVYTYITSIDLDRWSERDDVFFIVNSLDDQEGTNEEIERKNINNLNEIKDNVIKLKAKKSMIRMRLPYNYRWQNSTFTYFEGIFYLQPWNDKESTQLCLVVDDKFQMFNYSIKDYESLMFYFNKTVRQKTQFLNFFTSEKNPVDIDLSLLNDYDSAATSYIIHEYILKHCQENISLYTTLLLKKVLSFMEEKTGKTIFKLRSGIL